MQRCDYRLAILSSGERSCCKSTPSCSTPKTHSNIQAEYTVLRLRCWKSKLEGAGSSEKVTENDRGRIYVYSIWLYLNRFGDGIFSFVFCFQGAMRAIVTARWNLTAGYDRML